MDHRKDSEPGACDLVIASLLVAASGATSAAVPAPDVSVSAFERDAHAAGKISAAVAPLAAPYAPNPPHYFGPWPNWANSPMTVPDSGGHDRPADDPGGVTAEATARLGWMAPSPGITITKFGSGYTVGPWRDDHRKRAPARRRQPPSIPPAPSPPSRWSLRGGGYTQPQVTIGGAGTLASATAFGEVDSLTLTPATPRRSGYHIPTVSFEPAG